MGDATTGSVQTHHEPTKLASIRVLMAADGTSLPAP
jgi:hypothetical protein